MTIVQGLGDVSAQILQSDFPSTVNLNRDHNGTVGLDNTPPIQSRLNDCAEGDSEFTWSSYGKKETEQFRTDLCLCITPQKTSLKGNG